MRILDISIQLNETVARDRIGLVYQDNKGNTHRVLLVNSGKRYEPPLADRKESSKEK